MPAVLLKFQAMNQIHRCLKKVSLCSYFLLLWLGFAIQSQAGDAPVLAPLPTSTAPQFTVNTGDNAWLLASSALVLMMTAPGLILFYGGLVRTKNVLSTMMHSLVLMAIISVLWMIYGYSMAFGEGNAFCGNPFKHLFLSGVSAMAPDTDYAPTIPAQTFMLFQMMFAVIT